MSATRLCARARLTFFVVANTSLQKSMKAPQPATLESTSLKRKLEKILQEDSHDDAVCMSMNCTHLFVCIWVVPDGCLAYSRVEHRGVTARRRISRHGELRAAARADHDTAQVAVHIGKRGTSATLGQQATTRVHAPRDKRWWIRTSALTTHGLQVFGPGLSSH